jgi:hypothetical protein
MLAAVLKVLRHLFVADPLAQVACCSMLGQLYHDPSVDAALHD